MRNEHAEQDDDRRASQSHDMFAASARARRESAAVKRTTALALRDARKRRERDSQPPRDPRLLEAQLRAARTRRRNG